MRGAFSRSILLGRSSWPYLRYSAYLRQKLLSRGVSSEFHSDELNVKCRKLSCPLCSCLPSVYIIESSKSFTSRDQEISVQENHAEGTRASSSRNLCGTHCVYRTSKDCKRLAFWKGKVGDGLKELLVLIVSSFIERAKMWLAVKVQWKIVQHVTVQQLISTA